MKGLFSYCVGVGESYQITVVTADTQEPIAPNPGQTFTLTIRYNPSGLSQTTEESLGLYWWDGAGWVREPSSQVNLTEKTVTAHPNHLSQWAVMGSSGIPLYLPLVSKR